MVGAEQANQLAVGELLITTPINSFDYQIIHSSLPVLSLPTPTVSSKHTHRFLPLSFLIKIACSLQFSTFFMSFPAVQRCHFPFCCGKSFLSISISGRRAASFCFFDSRYGSVWVTPIVQLDRTEEIFIFIFVFLFFAEEMFNLPNLPLVIHIYG